MFKRIGPKGDTVHNISTSVYLLHGVLSLSSNTGREWRGCEGPPRRGLKKLVVFKNYIKFGVKPRPVCARQMCPLTRDAEQGPPLVTASLTGRWELSWPWWSGRVHMGPLPLRHVLTPVVPGVGSVLAGPALWRLRSDRLIFRDCLGCVRRTGHHAQNSFPLASLSFWRAVYFEELYHKNVGKTGPMHLLGGTTNHVAFR